MRADDPEMGHMSPNSTRKNFAQPGIVFAGRWLAEELPSAESLWNEYLSVPRYMNSTRFAAKRTTFLSGEKKKDLNTFEITMTGRGIVTCWTASRVASELKNSRGKDNHPFRSSQGMKLKKVGLSSAAAGEIHGFCPSVIFVRSEQTGFVRLYSSLPWRGRTALLLGSLHCRTQSGQSL